MYNYVTLFLLIIYIDFIFFKRFKRDLNVDITRNIIQRVDAIVAHDRIMSIRRSDAFNLEPTIANDLKSNAFAVIYCNRRTIS